VLPRLLLIKPPPQVRCKKREEPVVPLPEPDRDVIITDSNGIEEEKTSDGKIRLVPEASSTVHHH